jgi:hypothetical protein
MSARPHCSATSVKKAGRPVLTTHRYRCQLGQRAFTEPTRMPFAGYRGPRALIILAAR